MGMAPSSCEGQRMFTDVEFDTECHLYFRAILVWFLDLSCMKAQNGLMSFQISKQFFGCYADIVF